MIGKVYYSNEVLKEYMITLGKMNIKVCKDCGNIGHNSKIQNICPLKISETNKKMKIIKDEILNSECLNNSSEEILNELCKKLDISMHACRTLYSKIPPEELVNRPMDIDKYILTTINKDKCKECDDSIYITSKTRIWQDKKICDYCWWNHKKERDEVWDELKKVRPMICYICNKEQKCSGERYHYDHKNMFTKNESICSMIDRGCDIKETLDEMNKCQILCISCHTIITDIEMKCGFIRMKTLLTKQINNNDITETEYNNKKERYSILYIHKMNEMYELLKQNLTKC